LQAQGTETLLVENIRFTYFEALANIFVYGGGA
jgi:hypothetical protein